MDGMLLTYELTEVGGGNICDKQFPVPQVVTGYVQISLSFVNRTPKAVSGFSHHALV